MSKDRGSILVIGDTHLPFEMPQYLEFCREIYKRCKCSKVVHIGDLVDNHSISYHEHDPNGWSPKYEMEETDRHLQAWFKAFPKLKLCRGNHDALVDRKGKTVGLPRRCFLPYREIWNLPRDWEEGFEFLVDGVRFIHGTRRSGKLAHVNLAIESMCSAAMGHIHSNLAVQYLQQSGGKTFGMAVGCGTDQELYSFAYGIDFRYKFVNGCGVVTDHGRYAQVFPMYKEDK